MATTTTHKFTNGGLPSVSVHASDGNGKVKIEIDAGMSGWIANTSDFSAFLDLLEKALQQAKEYDAFN